MCLVVFAWQVHADYPLVLAANRDEYFNRPAAPAHWWTDAPELLAGRDLEAIAAGLAEVIDEQYLRYRVRCNKTRDMSGGALGVPIVLRGPDGPAARLGAQHSQSVAAMLAHVPGLKVVAPSNAADAYGLLVAAIRDPDPVLVLEHEQLYAHEGDVAEWDAVPAFGRAAVVRGGRDVTVVAYSHATLTAREAASRLADKGISVEVVDLRSLRPLDMPAVFGSLAKTRRLVVVEEGWPACSVGSEICSRVATEAFGLLAAGPVKVSGADVPMPYAANLERLAVPDACDVVAAVERLCYRSPVASD